LPELFASAVDVLGEGLHLGSSGFIAGFFGSSDHDFSLGFCSGNNQSRFRSIFSPIVGLGDLDEFAH
jgi:hypothetical protein